MEKLTKEQHKAQMDEMSSFDEQMRFPKLYSDVILLE